MSLMQRNKIHSLNRADSYHIIFHSTWIEVRISRADLYFLKCQYSARGLVLVQVFVISVVTRYAYKAIMQVLTDVVDRISAKSNARGIRLDIKWLAPYEPDVSMCY